MGDDQVLNSENVSRLLLQLEESVRSSQAGVNRFIEPASGTLARATSRQHHLIFGRRGSGKSSLLRKAGADLTLDRRPIAFVDLETFKGHEYPDVLLSVLIKTFTEFAKWLRTAAIHPASKTSFWSTLFGTRPSRRPFDKTKAAKLADSMLQSTHTLVNLLHQNENQEVSVKQSVKKSVAGEDKDIVTVGVKGIGFKDESSQIASGETSRELGKTLVQSKISFLLRNIMDYQSLFACLAELSGGDAFLFLDDLYHIPREHQVNVVDYFHRLAKSNHLWLKVGTIRHRSRWYVNGNPPKGMKPGDDVGEINLDQTLEKYGSTKDFLRSVFDRFASDNGFSRKELLADETFDRLVLASGGVARDFLGILRESVLVARERGNNVRGPKVGAEDVNAAAGAYDSSKREELSRDTIDESNSLEEELARIVSFVKDVSKANVFLMDRSLPDADLSPVEELVDLRLVHRVKSVVTVADRPGKKFEAFMLDVSQYTMARKPKEFEMIEFWKQGNPDSIRRTGLIFKEIVDGAVVEKRVRLKSN